MNAADTFLPLFTQIGHHCVYNHLALQVIIKSNRVSKLLCCDRLKSEHWALAVSIAFQFRLIIYYCTAIILPRGRMKTLNLVKLLAGKNKEAEKPSRAH